MIYGTLYFRNELFNEKDKKENEDLINWLSFFFLNAFIPFIKSDKVKLSIRMRLSDSKLVEKSDKI